MKLSTRPLEPKSGGDGVTEKWWVIPEVPVTNNVLLRMHWTKQRAEKKRWIKWLLVGGPPPRKAPWKARVSVQVRRTELQDPDNAVASVKPLLDALKARGWLYDDSRVHLELMVLEFASPVEQTMVTWKVLQVEGGR